jgi:hypothetical protein
MKLDHATTHASGRHMSEVDSQSLELRDEADDFEDALAAEMLRTGAIEVWI